MFQLVVVQLVGSEGSVLGNCQETSIFVINNHLPHSAVIPIMRSDLHVAFEIESMSYLERAVFKPD